MRGAIDMDLLPIGVGLVALILGAATGWLVARLHFIKKIAELNSKLVLERRSINSCLRPSKSRLMLRPV